MAECSVTLPTAMAQQGGDKQDPMQIYGVYQKYIVKGKYQKAPGRVRAQVVAHVGGGLGEHCILHQVLNQPNYLHGPCCA